MNRVNEIVLRMRESLGVLSDKELGERLNGDIKTSTISNWKTRESIPYSYIDQLTKVTGRTFEWFLTGKEPKPVVSEPTTPYESNKRYPADLQRIVDEWPELCEVQRTAVISVLDAFSKQTTNSLEISENKA